MNIKNIIYGITLLFATIVPVSAQVPVSMSHWILQPADVKSPDSLATSVRAIDGVLDHPDSLMYLLHAPWQTVRDSLFLRTDENRYAVVGKKVAVSGPWKRFVTFVELDGLIRVPNDTTPDFFRDAAGAQESANWGVAFIGADKLHLVGIKGDSTIGAGIDTGIDKTHSEFAGRFLWGYNAAAGPLGGTVDTLDFSDTINGCNGHGTHTTSTIGGATLGIAPKTGVVHYRVFDPTASTCVAYTSSTVRAINHAVGRGVDAMNVSIGHTASSSLGNAATLARNAGSIVCGANGNSGTSGLFYPAGAPDGFGSAAVDGVGSRASFSNSGPETDIGAPGVNITGAMPGGGYANKSGTSMASPTSCGAFLLLFSTPEFRAMPRTRTRVDSAQSLLCRYAERKPVGGHDDFIGCGTLNVARAVAGLRGGALTSWSSKNYQTAGTSVTDSMLYVCATDECQISTIGPVTILRQGTYIVFTATGNGSINIHPVGMPTGPTLPAEPTPTASITVNEQTQFQTMAGWEATAQVGQAAPGFSGWRDALSDSAVALGINRLRIELASGTENTTDYYAQFRAGTITNAAFNAQRYAWVNDNSSPNTINAAGFKWSKMDESMDGAVVPLRNRLLAKGENLYLSMNYVSFGNSTAQSNPAEYAELILAAFQHLQSKYGFVPNAVEMILEPDNNTIWNGTAIGNAIVATGNKLAAAGFYPEFVAPSVTNLSNALPYLNAIVAVPGAQAYLKEVSYHRYQGLSDANLVNLAARASQLGIRTSMLEHIASGVEDLYADLTLANVSAWQQYTLAYPTGDNGAQYFPITNNVPVMGNMTYGLRQYFKYVRAGAVRVSATSDVSRVRPVAFKNVSGGSVVVMHLSVGEVLSIQGLPAGQYKVSMNPTLPTQDVTISTTASGKLFFTAPSAGIVTIYRAN